MYDRAYLIWEALIFGDGGGVMFSLCFPSILTAGVVAAGGEPGKIIAEGATTGSSRSTEDEVTSPLPNLTSVMKGINAWQDSSSLGKVKN